MWRADKNLEKYIYRFIIEDNGPGIDKGIIEKAVKSIPLNYSQKEKRSGIGLGLWLSNNIVRVLNGDLEIKSSLGVGTRCTISLPVSTDKNYFQNDEDTVVKAIMAESGGKKISAIYNGLIN